MGKERGMGRDWGDAVARRINSSIDLVAAEAKYHRTCAQNFLTKNEKTQSVGKPIDGVKEHAFHELCKFLDETDECQYSVSELLDYMKHS